MFAVETGRFRFQIGEAGGVAGSGELVVCPPGLSFQRELISSTVLLHYILFELSEPFAVDGSVQLPSFKSTPVDEKRLASNFSYFRRLHYANDPRSLYRKQWMLNDLWQLACDEWLDSPLRNEPAYLSDSKDPLMNQAAKILTDKAYTPFSMREVAEELGISPTQFTHRFRNAFEIKPSEMVRTLRIRKAAHLLLETEFTLDQIASRCGYDNGFYLSRVFSNCMNASPTQYRQQHRV
jgi:AraC-like DNA-binding protein